MPTTRTRRSRKLAEEFSSELIAWIRGEAPFPVEAYFIQPAELERLRTRHGVPGVKPRGPGERDE